MLITRKPKSAHWYLPDGTPFHEVPNASKPGLMRPATIRDAFKAGAYRSVTSVLDMVAKPGLVDWKIEQAILSALTLPRIEAESAEDFAMRALVDSEEQSARAREMGTKLHDAAERYLTKREVPTDPEVLRLFQPVMQWIDDHVEEVIAAEDVVVNRRAFYAGRRDLKARMVTGGVAVIDFKSQDVKPNAKGDPKPEFYDEWPLQLAAYNECDPFPATRLISVVIDRTRPGVYHRDWCADDGAVKSWTTYLLPFLSLCDAWAYFKRGTPGKDAKAA